MKNLNLPATRLIAFLLLKMGDKQQTTLSVPRLVPIGFEKGSEIETSRGKGICYTIFWDLPLSPEGPQRQMTFVVIDNRQGKLDNAYQLLVYPQALICSGERIHEESMECQDGKVIQVHQSMQIGHAWFAAHWLKVLKEQGYFKDR